MSISHPDFALRSPDFSGRRRALVVQNYIMKLTELGKAINPYHNQPDQIDHLLQELSACFLI
jgi:hypothetical protein